MLRYVLIAEDHPICTTALTMAIHSLDSAIVVDTVATLADARHALNDRTYDAVFLDLGLKDSEGLVNLSVLRSLSPDIPILIVSANDSPTIVARSRALGAQGFLSKSAPISDMKEAVNCILSGTTYFSDTAHGAQDGTGHMENALARLSKAQTKVMIELARGHSNKVIAYELGLSEATIKSHLSAIFRVLGVTNRSQAILALKTDGSA